MKKLLMTGLLIFASNWVKGKFSPYSKSTVELTKLKVAIVYLQTIKTMRLLFMSLLGLGVCLVLLFSGLVLFHLAVFLYSPWSMETKMALTLGCAVLYVSIAVAVFYSVFSEDKWLKIFNADKMIRDLSGNNDESAENTPTTAEGTEFARRSSL